MPEKPDDLDAVRQISDVLGTFDNPDDRERVLRWVRERLGMQKVGQGGQPPGSQPPASGSQGKEEHSGGRQPAKGIRAFIEEKSPKNNQHLAAVAAYYHQFVGPVAERRDFITADDLIEACRQSNHHRPSNPGQVLINAYHSGLFDRGETGQYKLNAVGENLVAMVLPEGDTKGMKKARKTTKKKTGKKM